MQPTCRALRIAEEDEYKGVFVWAGKRIRGEQIINKLREAEVERFPGDGASFTACELPPQTGQASDLYSILETRILFGFSRPKEQHENLDIGYG